MTVTMLPGATEILALLTAATLPYQADKSRTCKTACCGSFIMPPGGIDRDVGPVCRRRRHRRPYRRLCRRGRLPEQPGRSEEHTSELQSLMRISYAVFCLKKKKQDKVQMTNHRHNTNSPY